MVENEVIFRDSNERVIQEFNDIKEASRKERFTELIPSDDIALHFLCECSDENCIERIALKQSMYKELHRNSSQFIILPSHNEPKVERIVNDFKTYLVVEKYMTPPKNVKTLKKTDKNT